MERKRGTRIRLKCIALGAAEAGKTSVLRRYFLGTPLEARVPTVGADFYTGMVPNPLYEEPNKEDEKKASDGSESKRLDLDDTITTQKVISVQMWDTAGRERFMEKRQAKYSAALSDAFFRHADAAMLVYDATSSTSFTQLLQWHSDLMEKMKSLQESEEEGKYHKRERPFPVLIVANKMDLFQKDIAKPAFLNPVPQRDILGLKGKFKGKDSRYEYRASPPANEPANSRREEISTYMRTGNTWTSDGSYLDSVLNTEDGSHPDRDLVLLWCMRNGLKHVEVSAMDGTGIHAAIEALVGLALISANDRLKEQIQIHHDLCNNGESAVQAMMSNKVLDLHQRYAPEENVCKFWPPFVPRK